jgi:hypothetical protein
MDYIVSIFWSFSLLYLAFVVQALPTLRRVRYETVMKHWMIAIPVFGGACWLYTLHFSGTTRQLGELISRIDGIDPRTSDILSTVLTWIISGVTGNFAYDIVKRVAKYKRSTR